jgi:tetratricopeptide (TPR) repeat protein
MLTAARGRAGLMVLAAGMLTIFAVASYALPWAAARDVEKAQEIWPRDPKAAFDRLDRASNLNFLSSGPDLAAGAIAARLDDRGKARAAFEAAVEREPRNWYAHLELGAIAALEGDDAEAARELAEARSLNPRDLTVRLVQRRAEQGDPLSLARVNEELVAGICDRLGRAQGTSACPR